MNEQIFVAQLTAHSYIELYSIHRYTLDRTNLGLRSRKTETVYNNSWQKKMQQIGSPKISIRYHEADIDELSM